MDKPVYRQSNIKNLFECPKRFQLSQRFDAVFSDNTRKTLNGGLIFEAFLFDGMNGAKLDTKSEDFKDVCKGRSAKTIGEIKALAEKCRPIFVSGKAYNRFLIEGMEYDYRGEMDYIGVANIPRLTGAGRVVSEPLYAIWDVKFTGDIPRIWGSKLMKWEFMQSISYTWAHWKKTGRILPFVYVLVENKPMTGGADPVVKFLQINATEKDFEWWEATLERAHHVNGLFSAEEIISGKTCGSAGMFNGRCWYLSYCEAGKDWLTGTRVAEFSNLLDQE